MSAATSVRAVAAALFLLCVLFGQESGAEEPMKQLMNQQFVALPLDRNAFRMSFGKRAAVPAAAGRPQMDGNSFRMSLGKRAEREEMLTHANIPIPLLFDLGSTGPEEAAMLMPEEEEAALRQQQKHWPPRWRASLFKKRLDRNLFNVGFGRR